ncbi:ATP-binding protein [Streptomyces sp. NPDC051567]|uniref:ATP-binding protein n=1 Tax=Streptomyces sp. NPDC051567 TaxID=3365660 RepID=UPI0037B99052
MRKNQNSTPAEPHHDHATEHPSTGFARDYWPAAGLPATGPVVDGVEVRFRRAQRASGGAVAGQDLRRPGQMRRIGRAYLRRWGVPELVDTTCLLLSELVTNSLVHGEGETVGVRLYLTPEHLCVEVRDGGPWVPRPPAGPLAQHGRGLLLVDALADAWGIAEDGGCVWCVLRRNLPQPETPR